MNINKVSFYSKASIQKLIILLHSSNKQLEIELTEIQFIIPTIKIH